MKKLLILTFPLLFLLFPRPVKAVCYTINIGVTCRPADGMVVCGNEAPGFCCSSQVECNQKAQDINPTNQSGTVDFPRLLYNLEGSMGLNFAGGSLGSVVSGALVYVFAIAGILLLLYFLMGGFKLLTSGGDTKKIQEGKTIITNAVIGFVIVFVAFWMVQLAGSLLGLPSLIGTFGQ